jgi:long-chain acyl-CoA synthetase
MTESASQLTFNHYYRHVIGSVGTPVLGAEIQIRDESGNPMAVGEKGEICIRARNIMKDYPITPRPTKPLFGMGNGSVPVMSYSLTMMAICSS